MRMIQLFDSLCFGLKERKGKEKEGKGKGRERKRKRKIVRVGCAWLDWSL